MLQWPPPFTIKQSARAKHLQLQISERKGLEVIVPRRYRHTDIEALLNSKRTWIEKHAAIIHDANVPVEIALPKEISLRGLEEVWQVRYEPCVLRGRGKPVKLLLRPQQQISIYGYVDNKDACQKLLLQWLASMAERYLIPWLDRLSEQTELGYKDVIIRGQRTRWGSCSSEKVINLNYKLLFLPPEHVVNTLLHELCHTVYMNHSAQFWQLLARFDANWQYFRNNRKDLSTYVPAWVEADEITAEHLPQAII